MLQRCRDKGCQEKFWQYSPLFNYHEIAHKLINEWITQARTKSMPSIANNRFASNALAAMLFRYFCQTERSVVLLHVGGATISHHILQRALSKTLATSNYCWISEQLTHVPCASNIYINIIIFGNEVENGNVCRKSRRYRAFFTVSMLPLYREVPSYRN